MSIRPEAFGEDHSQFKADHSSRPNNHEGGLRNEFAIMVSEITGKNPAVFTTCPWNLKDRIPSPEEFSTILEASNMTEEQREKVVNLWLKNYREKITQKMLGNEYRLTQQGINQIKKRLGYEEKYLSWEEVEKIREYISQPEQRIRSRKQPVLEGKMSSLAREFGISDGSLGQYVDRLDIKDRYNLSPEDIEKIRNYRKELLEMGGTHKSKGPIAKLALEMGVTRIMIYRAARTLGISSNDLSEDDMERIRQYRNNPPTIGRPRKITT